MRNAGVEAARERAVRLNITVKPETKDRLDTARNKLGAEVNVSRVCDAALNAELDRLENPGMADAIARLRVEGDRRRGAPYRQGHTEGRRWAMTKASWAEICRFAPLTEDDVVIKDVQWVATDGSWKRSVPGFVGTFVAPLLDYGRLTPNLHGLVYGAPGFPEDEAAEEWIVAVQFCDQYWRGWLSGVQDVFAIVSRKLEPMVVAAGPIAETAEHIVEPEWGDPDDIPF